jgi:hypothetical protein
MTRSFLPQSSLRISSILGAFNAAPRVAAVLAVAAAYPLLYEVLEFDRVVQVITPALRQGESSGEQ